MEEVALFSVFHVFLEEKHEFPLLERLQPLIPAHLLQLLPAIAWKSLDKPDLLKGAKETPQQANLQLKQMSIAATTDPVLLASPADEQTITGPKMLYRDLSACNIFDVMPRLSEIHLPTLIICGTEDRLTPVKYSEYLHSHIAGSTLHIIPLAGHYVFREQPEAVNRVIDEWIQHM